MRIRRTDVSSRPRVVAITGASAGVGRATAHAFAQAGAGIGLIARGTDRLESAAAAARAVGVQVVTAAADVADADAVEEAAAQVERGLGPIDVWVNNAMAAVLAPVGETRPEEFRRVIEVTYLGYVHGTLAALRRMRPRERGVIVQVGSALAFRGIPLQATYCAAKHAVQGFTDSLRCELLHEGSRVRVVSVHLPALNTPQFDWVRTTLLHHPRPVAPVFDPGLAADAVVHAATHPRREYWVAGSTVKAIVGSQLAPWLADVYLARNGVAAQQASGPADEHTTNLWEPPPGDPGARGRFSAEARASSLQWWASKHRTALAAAAGSAAVALATGQRRRSQ